MRIVRPVTLDDLPVILDILNREIREGIAHFGTEPLTIEDLAREFANATAYPWFAAIHYESLVGFARANPWKSRGGYAKTCEVGLYVEPETQGQGVGVALYEQLLPSLQCLGFKTLLGGIALPNPASVRLHEKFGFSHVGTLPQVGWKFGAWRDVGYWALVFPDAPRAP